MRPLVIVVGLLLACEVFAQSTTESPLAPPPESAPGSPPGPPAALSEDAIQIEHFHPTLEPTAPVRDRRITIIRFDLSQVRPRLLTTHADGGARTAPEWADEFSLLGVINASMFVPDGRSTGLMIQDRVVRRDRDNPLFGGYLGIGDGTRPTRFFGRSCSDFDLPAIRRRYQSVIQNYRMLDCQGQAISWADPKSYSAAAIGMDRDGKLVFVHSRAPYRMRDLNRILAAPEHRLARLNFVEGGPEASVLVRSGTDRFRGIGSYETDFNENDDNRRFWDLPNVIGIERR